MMNILFVVPYVPSLVRVRSYQIIRHLSLQGHRVILATIWTNEQERQELQQMQDFCAEVLAVPLTRLQSLTNGCLALPTKFPIQYVYSWNSELFKLISQRITQKERTPPVDIVHVEHLRGARYGAQLISERKKTLAVSFPPVVWDSVDCISYLFKQASEKSSQNMKRRITSFELKRTERFEGWLAALFDRILVTSQKDKNALSALRNGKVNVPEINILPNGVDLEYFRSDNHARRESETLVISGKMSYHANVSMVLFFVNQVMPRVWKIHPNVQLWIVGKDPPPEITTLAQNPSITVTGTVKSIQPYLQSATIAVAPIQYGAGIQNKVIEAMASSTPVIATSLATAALSVTSGEELLIADTPDEWVMAISSLLKAPERRKQIGEKGRIYVENNHCWQDIIAKLVEIYKETSALSISTHKIQEVKA